MKSALLSSTARPAPAGGSSFYLDAEPEEKKEEGGDKQMDALMDMIRDACTKMDEGSKRQDARMDAIEERFAKADSAKADEDEKKEAEPEKADADEEEVKADEEPEKKEEEKEEKKEEAEVDAVTVSRAELAELRGQISALNARAPQIISDADRERFASIQETAEPVFQAFGDRAPGPLEGETPTQYKRRLGSKMQVHSPHWKDSRLSAIGDEKSLDVVLGQIYADAISVGRRGADVPEGNLRANTTKTEAGHTRITYSGDTSVLTGMFSGHLQRA